MAHQRNQPSMGDSLKTPHSVSLKVLRYALLQDIDATSSPQLQTVAALARNAVSAPKLAGARNIAQSLARISI